jgi:ABC-2 type transport system ATP-binding protein
MNDTVIKVVNLNKKYETVLALNDVSLNIEYGRIYGFIGQNGAGKTTLMRIITGLAFPSSGRIELFEAVDRNGLEKARSRMGCMIEHSGMFPNLTAKENLELQRILKGVKDLKSVDKVLSIAGIAETGKKKFKDFSMGMKQRLGIAAALLGDPELLILDEPLNGLDPMGVVEVREMIIRLNKEHNLTILISSHVLSALYMVASDFIIIHEGRIVDSITQAELASKCKKHVVIEVNRLNEAKEVLLNQFAEVNFKIMGDSKIILHDYSKERELLAKAFFDANILVTELSYVDDTLEDYFMSSIGGSKNA